MGARAFVTESSGKTPHAAFAAARAAARREHGDNPYSRSIATKDSFFMEELPPGQSAEDYAWRKTGDLEKWDDCGCIDLGGGRWLFFGMAPS